MFAGTTRRSLARITALVAASLTLVALPQQPASADEPVKTLSIALIGDSYTAGNGAGDYIYGDNSYRSSANWASLYAKWLTGQGVHTTVVNAAHAGWPTSAILHRGVPEVPSSADLVMFTAGGNDAQFETIVTNCFALGYRAPAACKTGVDYATNHLPDARAGIEQILQALEAKLAPDAQVVLVGYPLLATKATYKLKQCTGWLGTKCTVYDAGARVRELGAQADTMQSDTIRDWNAHHSLKATFVSTQSAFAGHEPDPSTTSKNSHRWLNEFLETRGRLGLFGYTIASSSTDTNEWYHPNKIGHQQIANLLASAVGVPSSVRTPSEPLDRPFASIQGPYLAKAGSTLTLDASASFATDGPIVRYEWDLDDDGFYEHSTTDATLSHYFPNETNITIRLRVTGPNGVYDVATTTLTITDDGDRVPRESDNCPDVANQDQSDADADGVGDLCDSTPGLLTKDKSGVTQTS
jgi:lysophospholipase L1-like esterase